MGRYFPYGFRFSSPLTIEACAARIERMNNSPQLRELRLYEYTLAPIDDTSYQFQVVQKLGFLRFRGEGIFHNDGHGKTLVEGTAFIQLRYIIANLIPFVPVLLLSLLLTSQGRIYWLLPAAILLIMIQGGVIRAYQRHFIRHIHHDFL